jgi:hypothetical protein
MDLIKNKLETLEKTSISNEIIIDRIFVEKNENIPELVLNVVTGLNIKYNYWKLKLYTYQIYISRYSLFFLLFIQ